MIEKLTMESAGKTFEELSDLLQQEGRAVTGALLGEVLTAGLQAAFPTGEMDRIFKPPFSMTGAISQDRERCQFLFCLMKNPLLYRAARPESGREVRERSLMAPLARTQSERRRRLALASGFRLAQIVWNRSTRRAGARGGARVGRPRWLRILMITGGSSMAAMIFKAPPQFGQCSMSMSKTRLSSRAQLMRGVSPWAGRVDIEFYYSL